MIPRNLATIGSELANASTETNAVFPILVKEEERRKDRAKAERAAGAGAEAGVVHAPEVDRDRALDPAPIGQGAVVEAEAVPAVQRAVEDPALKRQKVLALLRAPKAGRRSLEEIQRRRLYAVHISRINVIPKSADTSTMDLVDSIRKVTAKRVRTANSNMSMNLEPLQDTHRIDRSHPTKRGRTARKTAKLRIDRTHLLPDEAAQIRRVTKTKRVNKNLLLGHPKVAVEGKARRTTRTIMLRSLLRDLLWSNKEK